MTIDFIMYVYVYVFDFIHVLHIQTPTKLKDTDGQIAGTNRESGSVKKRKRRSIAGLEKVSFSVIHL